MFAPDGVAGEAFEAKDVFFSTTEEDRNEIWLYSTYSLLTKFHAVYAILNLFDALDVRVVKSVTRCCC